MNEQPPDRRAVIKALVYVTPAILTLPASPAHASPGSLKDGCETVGGKDRFPCVVGG